MSWPLNNQHERVVLVDQFDNDIGTMDKLEAHQVGALHRAFSVFVFNGAGDLLLQRRAAHKYHSGSLWTNTCCSHPRPGEAAIDAAHRRLQEEMGMVCHLAHSFTFTYRSEFDDGLIEHEIDHVFVGYSDDHPDPVPSEVLAVRYTAPDIIRREIRETPEIFTTWFQLCFERVIDDIHQKI
jgi:isopentenyl-diphosphate delta-isomerase